MLASLGRWTIVSNEQHSCGRRIQLRRWAARADDRSSAFAVVGLSRRIGRQCACYLSFSLEIDRTAASLSGEHEQLTRSSQPSQFIGDPVALPAPIAEGPVRPCRALNPFPHK
jgi:hypothetical protein